MVIRDVARVLDVPYSEADSLAKMIPNEIHITIKKALEHLVKGGCLYVVVYIGHDQGKESTNLDAYFRTLDHKLYNVAKFEMMNKNNSPYVVIIEKR